MPAANLAFGGSGTNRTITVSPAAGASGTATIEVDVSDGTATARTTFTLVVDAVPTITGIPNQTTTTGVAAGPIGFTITDADGNPANLLLLANSNNPTLVPSANLTLGGSGGSRTVTVNPAAGQVGTAEITIVVSDGTFSATTSFTLTVNPPPNTPPTITPVGDQATTLGTVIGPIAFTVGDAETAAGSLLVSARSGNTTLIPDENLVLGGSGSDRTLTVKPAAGLAGAAPITLSVSDGTVSTETSFTLAVNTTLGRGLVAAYAFDETSGTKVHDLSGNGNEGVISGADWTADGRFGSALSFDGASSLVQVPSSASLNLGSAMTLEAWVNPAAAQSGWRTIVQREVDGYFLHAGSNGALRPAGGGTFNGKMKFTAASSAITVGAWTHLALTYDGANLRLYVNGALASTTARTGALETSNNPLRIGGNVPYGEYFQGLIDEVRVYNRALATAEIQYDMQNSITVQAAAASWGHTDIGDVALPGSDDADPATATITVEGSGTDIGGAADAFRFLYRPLHGDGMIEARVESLTNTNPGAKAGLMIRESLTANARNAFIFVTPAGSVGAQARLETGGATGTSAVPTQPWIRLVRTGDTLVAEVSRDGVGWTAVAAFTAPMGADVYAGFAVTSHDDSQLATAVFGDPFIP